MKLSRSARFRLGATLLIGGALAACALDPLNPQPLPPSPEATFDAGSYTPRPNDAGIRNEDSLSNDAGASSLPDGASPPPKDSDAGDAGPSDAGDAGDADAKAS